MSEVYQPSARIHRVTTRRRTLRELQCPLEPELLIAEFAGELPPDVALAVREHIAVCEICGERSQALRVPYELLSALGDAPAPFVPDLRDTVRHRVGANRVYRGVIQTAAAIGRSGAMSVLSIIGVLTLAAFLLVGVFYTVNARQVGASANKVTHALAAAQSGKLLAQTDKVMQVSANGRQWNVAEVIVVDEHSGAVLSSLPSASHATTGGDTSSLPIASVVAPDGSLIYELTAANSAHAQAVVAIQTHGGAIRFVAPLQSTDGVDAVSLTFSPDGQILYVGLAAKAPSSGGARALVFNALDGSFVTALAPEFLTTISLPPQPGSLPVSAFPATAPHLDATKFQVSLGLSGALITSPDGRWLFDTLLLSSNGSARYIVIRRFSALTGLTQQELALSGDFSLAYLTSNTAAYARQLAALGNGGAAATATTGVIPAPATVTATTPAPSVQPQLYLLRSSPDAQMYILDATANGPMLLGDIPLGGQSAPANTVFAGTLSVSLSADGTQLYATQNVSGADGQLTSHDFWLMDTQAMLLLAHRVDADAADAALANGSTDPQARMFLLRNGEIDLAQADITGSTSPWLILSDGRPVLRLLATIA